MIPTSASDNKPDVRMTGAGLVFLAISIVIGMGIAHSNTNSLMVGVGMLVLPAIIYFAGSPR